MKLLNVSTPANQIPSFDYWCKKQYNKVVKYGDQPTFVELISNPGTPEIRVHPQIELTLPSGLLIKIYSSHAWTER